MPTGYTSKIHDGLEVNAKEFIMDCSRAFGALVMMRDAPSDAEIPEQFEPSMHAKEQVDMLKEQLVRSELLSEKEALTEMETWYQEQCERDFNLYQTSVELVMRYTKMLEMVEKWNPPTPDHEGLKDFCMKQLRESLDFDCSRAFKPYAAPVKPILDTWFTDRIERLKKEIAYYEKSHQEEIDRTEDRNKWLKHLRDSLKEFDL